MHPMSQLALRAARTVYDYYDSYLDKFDIAYKDGNVAELLDNTAARVENSLVKQLQRGYPDLPIIERGQSKIKDGWKINPVVGLKNLMRAVPNFGLSISVYLQGKLDQTLVINPITNREFIAAAGRTSLLNSKRIRVNNLQKAQPSVAMPTPNPEFRDNVLHVYMAMLTYFTKDNADIINSGSEVFDILAVATGYLDAAIIFKPAVEELEPAFLIAKEAGCLIGDMSGNPNINTDGCLLVANPKYFKNLIKNLSPIYNASSFV